MKSTAILLLFTFTLTAFMSDKPAYRLYAARQQQTTYQALLQSLSGADIVLFGELHNNPICHWLELQLAKDLYASKKGNLVLGAEMFEADNQLIVDEYLKGLITTQQFTKEAKVWDNFPTDYQPLLDFALQKKVPFVASNVPRRYAAMVARNDFAALDSLPAEVRQWIAPLPIAFDPTLPGYAGMLEMMGGSPHGGAGGNNIVKAQALKDATMAHFILKNRQPGKLFLHFNGAYHSNNYEGIVWYLRKSNPSLKIVTLSSVEQEHIEKLEAANSKLADYVVCIPADMTKTY